jgi:putative phosphonate metabolism protein
MRRAIVRLMRYAIYFVPTADDPLWDFANRWLGRDPETGAVFDCDAAVVGDPRRYGFHATLKPPFALAPGKTEADLVAALVDFARRTAPFDVPDMRVAKLGRFLAIVPGTHAPSLHALADACVRDFDGFRATADEAEIAKRRKSGLSAREDEHLLRWGYPYVFDTFRFHMTLTGRLDEATATRLEAELVAATSDMLKRPLGVREIALFTEPQAGADFVLTRRLPLGSA